MRTVAAGLERLAHGDLTAELSTPFPPDLEPIRVDFNATVVTLRDTVRIIARSTEVIRIGTADIVDATDGPREPVRAADLGAGDLGRARSAS